MPYGLTQVNLALAAPVFLLWLALLILGLADLIRRPASRIVGGNKLVWGLVIALIATIGPLVYFAAGRKRE